MAVHWPHIETSANNPLNAALRLSPRCIKSSWPSQLSKLSLQTPHGIQLNTQKCLCPSKPDFHVPEPVGFHSCLDLNRLDNFNFVHIWVLACEVAPFDKSRAEKRPDSMSSLPLSTPLKYSSSSEDQGQPWISKLSFFRYKSHAGKSSCLQNPTAENCSLQTQTSFLWSLQCKQCWLKLIIINND